MKLQLKSIAKRHSSPERRMAKASSITDSPMNTLPAHRSGIQASGNTTSAAGMG
ncbi:MAG TPA: hypothetical protein VLM42_17155 [Bryobacteraceae bacterium]|nr:hypothetical protein [Bryobacteraceae bacterium]